MQTESNALPVARRGSPEHDPADASVCSGLGAQLRLEQRLLRSKDGNGKWLYQHSVVRIPVLWIIEGQKEGDILWSRCCHAEPTILSSATPSTVSKRPSVEMPYSFALYTALYRIFDVGPH